MRKGDDGRRVKQRERVRGGGARAGDMEGTED